MLTLFSDVCGRQTNYSRPRFKDAHGFFFRAFLTRGTVFKIPGTVTRLLRGQRRRNLRKKTRHCSRNTSISRKRRKGDHTAAGGWSFIFFVVKVDLPSTSQTVLLLYCERSGVAERRLHMTAVFCCGCWWLCCFRCCVFLRAKNMVLSPTTKPMHGSPARALVNRCDKLRLELARWFTTWFQAGGRRTASRREESLHTRTQ